MAHKISMRQISALMVVAFSGAAGASGFQLLEQNASGIGNSYAGSAAVAENASTIYFNPAGMTQLQDREVSGGMSAVNPSFHFHNQGSSAGAFNTAGEGGNAGDLAFIPNGYLSWALNKELYVGVGVGAPFGLKTEYDSSWIGAAQATMFDVKTYNVNPSIAYRLNDQVSLGAGLNWQRVEATYERRAAVGPTGLPGIDQTTPIKLTLDDDAWGWNAGALFTLSPSTKVGVSYRSAIKYHTEGTLDVNNGGAGTVGATAELKMPDTFIMSATQRLNDKWEMLGDVSWTGWSSIPKVDIMRVTGTVAQTLDTDFRDTWRVALGSNYQYNDAWKLKFGVAYDQTPVKRAETRLVSLPDNDRVWFSLGAQWAPNKASRLDLGLTYIVVRDSKVNNDQGTAAAPLRGRVTGEYTGNIWLLGAQYSMAF